MSINTIIQLILTRFVKHLAMSLIVLGLLGTGPIKVAVAEEENTSPEATSVEIQQMEEGIQRSNELTDNLIKALEAMEETSAEATSSVKEWNKWQTAIKAKEALIQNKQQAIQKKKTDIAQQEKEIKTLEKEVKRLGKDRDTAKQSAIKKKVAIAQLERELGRASKAERKAKEVELSEARIELSALEETAKTVQGNINKTEYNIRQKEGYLRRDRVILEGMQKEVNGHIATLAKWNQKIESGEIGAPTQEELNKEKILLLCGEYRRMMEGFTKTMTEANNFTGSKRAAYSTLAREQQKRADTKLKEASKLGGTCSRPQVSVAEDGTITATSMESGEAACEGGPGYANLSGPHRMKACKDCVAKLWSRKITPNDACNKKGGTNIANSPYRINNTSHHDSLKVSIEAIKPFASSDGKPPERGAVWMKFHEYVGWGGSPVTPFSYECELREHEWNENVTAKVYGKGLLLEDLTEGSKFENILLPSGPNSYIAVKRTMDKQTCLVIKKTPF